MVHRTPTRDKIKQLSAKAQELDGVLVTLSHEYDAETIDFKALQKQLDEDKNRIQAEVLALKPQARLEDSASSK
jgi:peptidoglycan hydrolase CwlO-like protein